MKKFFEKALKASNLKELNPMQKEVLAKYTSGNLVVVAPTASGKTLIAEAFALKALSEGKKVIYTAPLKALAGEHFSEWKRKYKEFKIAISTGDFDSSAKYLSRYDWIVTTNEKLDSLITHKAEWLSHVVLLIVDEIHEIASNRGATLESVIIKMRKLCPKITILALSATIPNAEEIAKWLNAILVKSDYRPVKLKEGILFGREALYADGSRYVFKREGYEGILEDTLSIGKQLLIFSNTRKNSERIAEKLADICEDYLSKRESKSLEKIAEKVLNVLEIPTEQCKNLAKIVKNGIAFHHAGLLAKQRALIEEGFRKGLIKAIVATPTLALGVNLPAYRVLIGSAYRHGPYGMELIPVSEYKQMAGRAGRPKYDEKGEALIMVRNKSEIEEFMERYIKGIPEKIESQLANYIILRMQVLSSVASNFANNLFELENFFSESLYALQYGSISELMEKIYEILDELISYGFVKEIEDKILATPLGRRVAELYIDPLSAYKMLQKLKNKLSERGLLFCLVDTTEFILPNISKKKQEEMFEKLYEIGEELGIDATMLYFSDENAIRKIMGVEILNDWINEKSEQEILEKYEIRPGMLQAMLQICDWLAYSASELAKMIKEGENSAKMRIMQARLKYGVKEELLPLVMVKHIGRVRARKLYKAGIRKISDLKKIDVKDLARIIGEKTAIKVKQYLIR